MRGILIFLKGVQNSKKLLLVSLTIIFLAALFLRFYKLGETFSDYDDIGVIALHKIPSGEKSFNLFQNEYLEVSGKVDLKNFSDSMLDTPFFAPYIGKVWTYPPGQYIFYPPIMTESDTADTKIWRGRAVSAFFSFLSVLLLAYFLFLINDKKLNWGILLALLPLAFSLNNVIYSHHMSPYSLNVTTLIFSLILYHFVQERKLKNWQFSLLLGILTYFNYLVILFLPVFALIEIFKHKKKLIESKEVFIKQVFMPVLIYILQFLPCLLLFFKPDRGRHGTSFPWFREGFISFITYLPKKVISVIQSNLSFFTTYEPLNICLSVFLVLGMIVIFINYIKTKRLPEWPLIFSLLFIVEWIILHVSGKILIEESRHLLIWTPLLCIMFFYLLKARIQQNYYCLCVIVLLVPSVYTNVINIDSKKNNFDREVINTHPASMVLTYGGTLGPMVYFSENKTVYNIEFRTFFENYKKINFPNKILLSSTNMTIEEFRKTEEYFNVKDFLSAYKIVLLKENNSAVNYFYNNKGYSGGQNKFYLYEMTKVK